MSCKPGMASNAKEFYPAAAIEERLRNLAGHTEAAYQAALLVGAVVDRVVGSAPSPDIAEREEVVGVGARTASGIMDEMDTLMGSLSGYIHWIETSIRRL